MNENKFIFGFIVIVILGIIALGLVIWQRNKLYTPTNFGTWRTTILEPCSNISGRCSDPATQLVEQLCIPNPQTGRGCLDKNGRQLTGKRIMTQPCIPRCRKYIWRDELGPCLGAGTTIDECIVGGTLGFRNIEKTCVANDPTGDNECTQIILNEYTNSIGQTGLQPQVITYEPGTVLVNELPCNIPDNPICGSWERVSSRLPPGTYNPDDIDADKGCIFNPILSADPSCDVANSSNDQVFNLLKEGYVSRQMACVKDDQAIIPKGSDPTLNICSTSGCSQTVINPEQVLNGTLPSPLNPFSCPLVNSNSNQPTCMHLCRRFPGPDHLGLGEFDMLLNNLLLIRILDSNDDVIGFVAPQHLPNQQTGGPLFKARESDPFIAATNLNLIMIPATLQKNSCPPPIIEFINSTMFMMAPRDYQANMVTAQFMILLAASYQGWLGFDVINGNKLLIWRQAYNFYQFPGANHIQVPEYEVQTLSPFSSNRFPGLPASQIGSIKLKITNNNDPIFVQGINGNVYNLNRVEVIVFNNLTNLTPRSSSNSDAQSASSSSAISRCNLYIDPTIL